MITNFFIPELNNHDVQELWLQQDGATCHTARATIDLLKDTLGDRLISRFGPVNWPPRSCDLTPLDYFLWDYVKSLVYADKPQTLDHLEDNIRRVMADIRPQMLEKFIENWTSRLDYIRASRGSPMPEIIFKMAIDFVNLMSYDFQMYSPNSPLTAHHSPLFSRNSDKRMNYFLNGAWAAAFWEARGMPRKKIMLGIPTHARTYYLKSPYINALDAPASGPGVGKGKLTYPQGTPIPFDPRTGPRPRGWGSLLFRGAETQPVTRQRRPRVLDLEN
ncbi:acidic mammalian chitinase [Trichonephila clavipes]|nr:acidic mammalian chitinase [Trichonephila clavipes]